MPTLEELKLQRLQYLQELQAKAAGLKQGVDQYMHDPVGFMHDCIDWGDSGGLTFYQEDIMALLEEAARRRPEEPTAESKCRRQLRV